MVQHKKHGWMPDAGKGYKLIPQAHGWTYLCNDCHDVHKINTVAWAEIGKTLSEAALLQIITRLTFGSKRRREEDGQDPGC